MTVRGTQLSSDARPTFLQESRVSAAAPPLPPPLLTRRLTVQEGHRFNVKSAASSVSCTLHGKDTQGEKLQEELQREIQKLSKRLTSQQATCGIITTASVLYLKYCVMTFIVRGQFKYIPCKCLATTILLLDMYKTPFICCVHITCPMQTYRGWTCSFLKRRVNGRSPGGRSLADRLKAPSRQVQSTLFYDTAAFSIVITYMHYFFLRDPDQRLSFHFYKSRM